ncbi:hypothetical protein DN406_04040 [Bacillus sp. BB56-3]|nr:hypothetical protein DN406_04040 [Bacillus sp. BB56-3]
MHSLTASSLIEYAIDLEHFLEWKPTYENSGINPIKDVSLTIFQNINPTQIKKDYVYYLNSQNYKVGRRLNGKQLTPKTLTRKWLPSYLSTFCFQRSLKIVKASLY